ncbi:hypothetical protein JHK82_014011 [Glycine max]|uniref:Uncharacterized protein n=1 Tax=Glycine max TaxID=3847 RepID=K7KSC5_SOYBN|nr:hypothetical protein JHK82_014011 [Glycine max]KAH1123566.1 hypothetical protein GYH30_013686 [Glycine max]KRH51439.1 hypothetical protein GLYMA_06G006300v4 [Glycine max]
MRVDHMVPVHFQEPIVEPYDGTKDIHYHLKAFRIQMLISGGSDAIKCKYFVGTLRDTAPMPLRSINIFDDFSGKFLSQFAY